MFIVNILSLILLVLLISHRFKVSAVKSWPVAVCIMVLIMYVLAFFRGLFLMDFISIGFMAVFLAKLLIGNSQDRRMRINEYLKLFGNAEFILSIVFFVIVTILVIEKKVTWWDDYNFWATDAKSLFGINGFASKYANVAPEFGDYPPGTQMFKWWFLHFNPSEFSEGLMFAGYYFMLFSFFMPVLDKVGAMFVLKDKDKVGRLSAIAYQILKVVTLTATLFIIWLFPTTVEAFWCDGCCADIIMAVIYGTFLITAVRQQTLFSRFEMVLYLSVLSLCKNTAPLWIFLAAVFYIFINIARGNFKFKHLISLLIPPVLCFGSWYGFCLIMRRVAKLTGTAISMATGSSGIPEYSSELTGVYFKAFVSYPLHRYDNGLINLSPLALFILLLAVSVIIGLLGPVTKKESLYITLFTFFSGIVFLVFNLICHLTIFAQESQYLEEFAMVSSIERYGSPFTVGTMMLLMFILLDRASNKWLAVSLITVFVLATTDYDSSVRAFVSYRDTINDTLAGREEIIDDKARMFLNDIKGMKNTRILYIRDENDVSWVRNTYIGFMASPVSVMFKNVDTDNMTSDSINDMMEEAHSPYYYYNGELAGRSENGF